MVQGGRGHGGPGRAAVRGVHRQGRLRGAVTGRGGPDRHPGGGGRHRRRGRHPGRHRRRGVLRRVVAPSRYRCRRGAGRRTAGGESADRHLRRPPPAATEPPSPRSFATGALGERRRTRPNRSWRPPPTAASVTPQRVGRGPGPLAGGPQAAQRARPRPGPGHRDRTGRADHPGRRRGGHRRAGERRFAPTRPPLRPVPSIADRGGPSSAPAPAPATATAPPAVAAPRRPPRHHGRPRPATRWSPSPTSVGAPPSTWSAPRPPRPTP